MTKIKVSEALSDAHKVAGLAGARATLEELLKEVEDMQDLSDEHWVDYKKNYPEVLNELIPDKLMAQVARVNDVTIGTFRDWALTRRKKVMDELEKLKAEKSS